MTGALPAAELLDIVLRVDALRDAHPRLGALGPALAGALRDLLGADEAALYVLAAGAWSPASPASPALQGLVGDLPRRADWQHHAVGDAVAWALAPAGRLLGAVLARGVTLDDATAARAAAFVSQADSALAHALVSEALADRNAELEAIYAIDRIRDAQLDFEAMLDAVMAEVLRAVPAATAVVGLARATEPDALARLRFARGTPPTDAAAERAVEALVRDAFAARGLVRRDRVGPWAGALCVPLILHDLVIGGLAVLGADLGPRQARVLTAIGSQVDTAIFEDLSRQRLKRIFKRYVSDQVVEEMLHHDADDYLRGRRREVTVIFTDLRGFTTVSEGLDVDVLVAMLNEHLAAMTEEVFRHGGTVDKFIGDCVMAFWGAPVAAPDHAERAIRACLALRRRHQQLQAAWRARGLPAPAIGIGVASGEVMVGNIGSERLSSYTVIGDRVNLAARLEGLAAGDDILIAQHTLEGLGDAFTVEPRGAVVVKGKTESIATFNVVDGPHLPVADPPD